MKKYLLASALTLIVFIGVVAGQLNAHRVEGNVDNQSSGYYSTTTPVNTTGLTTLKAGYGMLGSIIITGGPQTGNFYLYDATTSDVNKRTNNTATTTIILANIPAGSASTTYTYDTTFNYGLLFVPSGTLATSTITWK